MKETINEVIERPEYEFLSSASQLGNNIMFLTFGGSYAYGTNTPTSDIDVRGVAFNQKSDFFGMTNFEQYIDNATDTTVYGFRKYIELILKCNPNTIEMLGCRPEDYACVSELGKELIGNRKMFLSRRAVHSFGGYAVQQLRRLENALAHDHYPETDKVRHIMGSCNNAMETFGCRYRTFSRDQITLIADTSPEDPKILADVHMDHIPLREFIGIMNELTEVLKNYDKLNHRNKKKDDLHLNKHAMHLVRLYLTAIDIFEKEDIITHRENDIPLLMSIRNGDFQKEDHTYRKEFFDLVSDLEARFQKAVEGSSLPKHPDMDRVAEFVMSIVEGGLGIV